MNSEYLIGVRDTWYWVVLLVTLALLLYVVISGARRRSRAKRQDNVVVASAQSFATRAAQIQHEDAKALLEAVAELNRAATNFNKATDNVLTFLSEERAVRQQALAKLEREALLEK